MKKYEVIIFDLDGTLSNSGEGITRSAQYALSKLGIKEDNLDDLKHFVGPPLKEAFMEYYHLSDEMSEKAVTLYRERYVPVGIYETSLYPGIVELLTELKNAGKYLAIATSKPQPMAEEVLRYLKIYNFFDKIMGADVIGPKQSKRSVLEALFEEMEIKDKTKYVMIGDTKFDIIGANLVGVDSIGVSYGYGDKEEMLALGALYVADCTSKIKKFLLG
jgi:phosphoglycolate phosphatase